MPKLESHFGWISITCHLIVTFVLPVLAKWHFAIVSVASSFIEDTSVDV